MRKIDLVGQKYGRLTVVEMVRTGGDAKVRCVCDCGKETTALAYNVRNGNTASCGCLSDENRAARGAESGKRMGAANIKHGHTKNYRGSKTYVSWIDARKRCYSPQNQRYALYGGRGITMSDAWRNSFQAFLDDMGERPEGSSLDRIDCNGNYEKGNCRWATKAMQAQNQRSNKATWEIVRAIRQRRANGESVKALAQEFNMTTNNAYFIVWHKSWKQGGNDAR